MESEPISKVTFMEWVLSETVSLAGHGIPSERCSGAEFTTLVMKSADRRVKPCCLLAQGAADSEPVSVAGLFRVLTDPLDKNRFQVDNTGVIGPMPQTRVPNQDSRFCGRDWAQVNVR